MLFRYYKIALIASSLVAGAVTTAASEPLFTAARYGNYVPSSYGFTAASDYRPLQVFSSAPALWLTPPDAFAAVDMATDTPTISPNSFDRVASNISR